MKQIKLREKLNNYCKKYIKKINIVIYDFYYINNFLNDNIPFDEKKRSFLQSSFRQKNY